jgi:hypothetical protein
MKCRDCPADTVAVALTIPKMPGAIVLTTDGLHEIIGVMDHLCRTCFNRIYTRPESRI